MLSKVPSGKINHKETRMGKVVTVQDYLIKKDPEKYERLFNSRAQMANKSERMATDRRELLKEIEELETQNKKLVAENKIFKAKVPENAK